MTGIFSLLLLCTVSDQKAPLLVQLSNIRHIFFFFFVLTTRNGQKGPKQHQEVRFFNAGSAKKALSSVLLYNRIIPNVLPLCKARNPWFPPSSTKDQGKVNICMNILQHQMSKILYRAYRPRYEKKLLFFCVQKNFK